MKLKSLINYFKSNEFKKSQRETEKRNRKFAKMTRDQQRVEIAKDVLRLLGERKIEPHSTYFRASGDTEMVKSLALHPDAFQEHGYAAKELRPIGKLSASAVLDSKVADCHVCGIGSLFVSAVINADKLSAKNILKLRDGSERRRSEVRYLSRWFDADQLSQIEQFYETNAWCAGSPILDQANNRRRLRMIMENIISNGGKFDPHAGRHRTRP